MPPRRYPQRSRSEIRERSRGLCLGSPRRGARQHPQSGWSRPTSAALSCRPQRCGAAWKARSKGRSPAPSEETRPHNTIWLTLRAAGSSSERQRSGESLPNRTWAPNIRSLVSSSAVLSFRSRSSITGKLAGFRSSSRKWRLGTGLQDGSLELELQCSPKDHPMKRSAKRTVETQRKIQREIAQADEGKRAGDWEKEQEAKGHASRSTALSEPPMPAQHQAKPGDEAGAQAGANVRCAVLSRLRQTGRQGFLVTGGDWGIGRSVATLFAREGADVAVVFLAESGDAKQTQAAVENEGRRCVTIAGDVKDKEVLREGCPAGCKGSRRAQHSCQQRRLSGPRQGPCRYQRAALR